MSESELKMELSTLVKQRGIIKGRLTRFEQYVKELTSLKDIPALKYKELELKTSKIQSLISEFEEIQNKIDILHSDPDEQIQEREVLENKFINLIAISQELLDNSGVKKETDHNDQFSSNYSSHKHSGIKLPTIKLPTFDGNYLKWLEFKDTFLSVVDSNLEIPHINKFHYLRSALEGSAAVVIKSIEFSAKNYKVAWDLLCQRFENKDLLVNNHLTALFNIEPLKRESYKSLRFIVDHVMKHLRALETLGLPTNKWDILIIFMISSKLDLHTARKWQEHKSKSSELVLLTDFFDFLRNRADILETSYFNNTHSDKVPDHKYKTNTHSKSFVAAVDKKVNNNECLVCKEIHPLYLCDKFKGMTVDERLGEITKFNLCKNCFRSGHNAYQCRLKAMCRTCKKKHNTLVHVTQTENSEQPSTSSLPVSLSVVSSDQVLLSTALIQVVKDKKTYTARALLDTGSQSSFITDSLKEKLGLVINPGGSVNVCGINNSNCSIKQSCNLKLKSRCNSFEIKVKCLVVPRITGILPNSLINTEYLKLPSNIVLADPNYFFPSEVDILLGADVYWDIVGSNLIKLGNKNPVLQESKFGWLVSGPISTQQPTSQVYCNFTQEIKESLERFWTIDDLPVTKTYSVEEQLCENNFIENFSRLPNGRFAVTMPFKESPEEALGNSYYIAKKCFLNLEKKFAKNPSLKIKYKEFIDEYANLGHLRVLKNKPEFGYYMPHHAVIREKSETTKLRVVFNASCKTSSGKSLNDIQMVGPVIQSDLISILLRFRKHKYVLTGDIEKMFRQTEIKEQQRHLQLILWRDDETKPIDILQLNTVTYGTASAPFLSTRCLLQLAKECEDKSIACVIENDFYADDLNTGSETVEGLKYIYREVVATLDSALLPLRKFRTNCPSLFENDDDTAKFVDFNKESSVLGLIWCPKSDNLLFSTDSQHSAQITKRSVISTTAKVFDPLGLLSPCIIVPKILLQQLWSAKLDWDDPVPVEFCKDWSNLLKEFSYLSDINIERWVLCDNPKTIELHCFVDASQQAYAACIYLRSEDCTGKVTVRLLCAKARVAPMNPTTIPRLELCGALLGARLCSKVLDSLQCNISRKVLWSDSMVVLGWVQTPPRDLKVFVCNRVNEINQLTPGFDFRYVPTDQNPADMGSRGVSPKQLKGSSLWWAGPSFLANDPTCWPTQQQIPSLPELKIPRNIECHTTIVNNIIEFEKYSNFNKLIRIYAYVQRFVHNCLNKNSRISGPLDVKELDKSLFTLVRLSQLDSYSDEIKLISDKKTLNCKSKLLSLNPFLDDNNILRVGGRLQNSEFDYDKKHPMILDAKHQFTQLLFRQQHERLFHAGPQHLLASIRERFWAIGGRNLARSTTKKCLLCTRFRGKTIQPIMGNLPSERTYSMFPFYTCGVDFAGPFTISSRKGRGSQSSKCYLCLFVCLSTKAIHLELVSSLSSDAFILSLKRFISRRGKPSVIYCDNGTNFRGANNEMCRVLRSNRKCTDNFANDNGIKFVFSPAYSPHFGGIWEAGVKSAKFHLKRTAGKASLTFEELATLLAQVEAILNSRPLSPLSSDPTDPTPLTPGHFLVGRPLTSLPSAPINTKSPNRYQLIEKIRQDFWQRWRREFVAELQQRTKWKTRQHELRVGDLVILKEENVPPLQWRLGRVTRLYPGTDGVSRVADVISSRGTVRRAVNKMCILPSSAPADTTLINDDKDAAENKEA
nr:uncharacterized protein LOC126055847 [Helicoverpa armigera]